MCDGSGEDHDTLREPSMAYGFLDITATPSVKAAQAANGSGEY
ncbi:MULTISPECIES: hypothetical protein [unclassified Sinorhizobium]